MTAPCPAPGMQDRAGLLRPVAEALLVLLVMATFAGTGWFSPGYDDEFYTIDAITRTHGLAALARFIDGHDVHPPLSYLLDAVLHDLTGSWRAVRALSGLAVAASLVVFVRAATRDARALFLPCLLIVGLHPTLVMWTASLRWTAPFTALSMLALALILRNPARPGLFWTALAALLVLLFHTNYEALLLGPLLVALAVHARRTTFRAEWKLVLAALGVAALLCVPQAMAMLHGPIGRRGSQTGALLSGLSGTAQGYLVNMGLFPLSIPGLLNMVAVAGLAGFVAITVRTRLLRQPLFLFWLAGTGLFLLSGIAVKPRNFTPLVPVLFLLLTLLPLGSPHWRRAVPLFLLLAACQLLGLAHVLLHRDTGKGSWNLPVAQVMEAVRERARACPGTLHVAVYDVVLAHWVAGEPGLVTVSPYRPASTPPRAGDCLVALLTYHGSLAPMFVQRMVASLPPSPATEVRLAPDPYADTKRRFDAGVPDAYVRLLDYGRLIAPVDLEAWHPHQVPAPE